jgi:hypothetical protein
MGHSVPWAPAFVETDRWVALVHGIVNVRVKIVFSTILQQ